METTSVPSLVLCDETVKRRQGASESQSASCLMKSRSEGLATRRNRLPHSKPTPRRRIAKRKLPKPKRALRKDSATELPVRLELMTERPSLHGLRFRGLGGRNASLFSASAHEHLHGTLAFARLIGVFVGVR